jgi:hypothetical protein
MTGSTRIVESCRSVPVASGHTVRMYRADGKRLVLLPAKGNAAAVLLEVGQPESLRE